MSCRWESERVELVLTVNYHIERALAPGVIENVISELATANIFSRTTDLSILRSGAREAVRSYCTAIDMSPTDRRKEISALLKAAEERRYEVAAELLQKLSYFNRLEIENRANRRNTRNPLHQDLLSTDLRDSTCKAIELLAQFGGAWIEESKETHDKGRRSWLTYSPYLLAPELPKDIEKRIASRAKRAGEDSKKLSRQEMEEKYGWKNRPKRSAEKAFVSMLRLAWLEATGIPPSMTAKRYNTDDRVGPFATFVERFLKLVGAIDKKGNGVSVVNLLNEMARDSARQKNRDTGWTGKLRPSVMERWLEGIEQGLCSVLTDLPTVPTCGSKPHKQRK
jgi:hypothetical protein